MKTMRRWSKRMNRSWFLELETNSSTIREQD